MTKPAFCAVPLAVVQDERLTASHWRLLCAIAWHDRFGANGTGCYASHAALAARAKVHQVNVSRLAADLAEWGHLEQSRNPVNRRLRVYRLIYNDNPATDSEPAIDSEQTNDTGEIDSKLANNAPSPKAPQLAGFCPQDTDIPGDSDPKYIPLSGIRNSAKQRATRDEDYAPERQKIGQHLRKLEDFLNSAAGTHLTTDTRSELEGWADYCDGKADDLDFDDPLSQWAKRLAEIIRDRSAEA